MSAAAYHVVLEDPTPGFNTFVDGTAVSKAASNIDRIARILGLKTLDEYVSADLTEFFDEEDEDDFHGTVADAHTVWFEAAEGLEWASRIGQYIEDNPEDVHDAEHVQQNLAEYEELFRNAAEAGVRWHLEVDF